MERKPEQNSFDSSPRLRLFVHLGWHSSMVTSTHGQENGRVFLPWGEMLESGTERHVRQLVRTLQRTTRLEKMVSDDRSNRLESAKPSKPLRAKASIPGLLSVIPCTADAPIVHGAGESSGRSRSRKPLTCTEWLDAGRRLPLLPTKMIWIETIIR